MAFFEIEFPRTISYKAVGGPGFNTTVNESFAGFEQRNKNWSASRGKWSVSLITPAGWEGNRQRFSDLLQAFFLAVSGKGDAFRLFDHKDNAAAGQTLGTGDGTTTTFQLVKNYTIGGRSYQRTITKPITSSVHDYSGLALANTVKIYDNGTLQTSGVTIDATTGIATFASAPANAHIVTADFQFHYPVRFDTDELPLQVEDSNIRDGEGIVSLNSIQLVEVRAPNY